MPTYSYRCANCDYAFDQYQAFTDESLTVCPNCGQSQLRKVFNSIGVSFTGSGFYRNDSRAENSKSSGSSSTPSSESSSATKPEAPAAKSEQTSSKSESPAPKSPAPKSGTVSSNSPSGPSGS